MDRSYQGNALLKTGPETPQTNNTILMKAGISSSDSQALSISPQARTFTHTPAPSVASGATLESQSSSHPFWSCRRSSPPFPFPVWHCQATLSLSSVITALFPFRACLPSLRSSPPAVLPGTKVQQTGLAVVTLLVPHAAQIKSMHSPSFLASACYPEK